MRAIPVTPSMDMLPLGRLGENERTKIVFDLGDWLEEYPGASISLVNKLPMSSEGYPCTLTAEGDGKYSWTITSAELTVEGDGECQLQATKSDTVLKGKIYKTKIGRALDDSATVPDPWESWITELTELQGDAEAAAEAAEGAVEHYPKIENGYWYVWDSANETWANTNVQAQGPAGQDGADGADGADGQDGQDGADGFSPTATVTKSGSTATISITDKNGTTTTTISDGETVDPTEIIDDTAGDGDTDKVWSADKSSELLSEKVNEPSSEGTAGQFLQTDGNGGRTWATPSGGGGTSDYSDLTNKPQINSVTLSGNKSFSDLGIHNLPSGGTTGQVLKKTSGTDYAVEWADKDPVENVSGSTPSITGVAGKRYICGECSTLSITAPASGCIDVVFESGSTATVLTVTSAKTGVSAVKWANGFDPSSLDANTTYELNILDGEFGVVGKWT